MISDLSFLCSTVTFADPPTLRDHRYEQGMEWKGCVCFLKKMGVRINVCLAEFMYVCIFKVLEVDVMIATISQQTLVGGGDVVSLLDTKK